MGGWLERYVAGEYVPVWTELSGLGADLRAEGMWTEAVEVARETMRRARTNVERLLELLPARGYEFWGGPQAPVFLPPPADIGAQLDRLEGRIGRLPFSLRCWFEEVGLVNLMGRHPDWRFEYTDPLVVEAPVAHIESEYELWDAERGTEWDRGPFVVDLAPDFLHKANVSGGAPYAMAVPNDGLDGLLLFERHRTTFVNYLRICFRRGGFTGWSGLRGWAAPQSPQPPLLTEVAEELLPI